MHEKICTPNIYLRVDAVELSVSCSIKQSEKELGALMLHFYQMTTKGNLRFSMWATITSWSIAYHISTIILISIC